MILPQRCKTMSQLVVVQASFIVHGIYRDNYVMSELIAFCALSRNGNLAYASLLFNEVETPNSFIYNTLIKGYSGSSQPHLSLNYLDLMLKDNVRPNNLTFQFIILACAHAFSIRLGKQMHSWAYKNASSFSDGYVQTAILRLYEKCKIPSDTQKVFDEIFLPDVFQCNVLMNGFIQCGLESEALRAFRDMLVMAIEPDEFCVTTALTACARSGALAQGKWIHDHIKKRTWLENDVFVGTTLIDMYAKCGLVYMAVKVFEEMPKRNLYSWAALIGGFAVHGFAWNAIHCLEIIHVKNRLKPDGVVLLNVLMACAHSGLQKEGLFLLENMEARYGVKPKHEHYSCMVDLLCRRGRLDEAIELIKSMPMNPLPSVWGALLNGCRIHKNAELAEIAVKKLECIDEVESNWALLQLSHVYMSCKRSEDSYRVHRLIGDKRMKKTPGCSLIEVDGMVYEFVAGDMLHKHMEQIHAVLELLLLHAFCTIH